MKQQNQTNPNNQSEIAEGALKATQVKENREQLEEPDSYEEAIEAILFAAGHPVSYETLAKTFELRGPILRNMVKEYAERYNKSKVPRGVILLAMDKECQLCTKPKYLSYIRSALGIRRNGTLSAANMETLAIVAYHQPVTRAYIDAVRGVDSSYAVSTLVERGLIEAKGRLDAPGRPVLFGTSTGFLRCFGLNSVEELPGLDNEELQQVFRKVEEKLESEAADAALDENQLTIDDAMKESEKDEQAASEAIDQAPNESEPSNEETLSELPFDLPDLDESSDD
jgi:segregation and condensation protein B